jgi:hypothetical protein
MYAWENGVNLSSSGMTRINIEIVSTSLSYMMRGERKHYTRRRHMG